MQYIKKRDGRLVQFNKNKIVDAILGAFKEVDGEVSPYAIEKANKIADYIEAQGKGKIITVEEAQDAVERGLMSTKRKDVARRYITYREERARVRNWNSQLMDAMSDKLNAENVQNSNANLDENSFGGRKNEADSVIMKQYALDNCMSEMARNNHLNNEIYIHDLDSYAVGMHNCLTMPLDKLLAEGFNTRQTDVRPANSIGTAMQLVAVLFQLQSLMQFGGVSASHLDWTMVPYVRKSFYKHYRDGMKYLCDCDNWDVNELLEDDDKYTEIIDIPINDYDYYINYADDSGEYDKVYRYAMDMTEKELRQAVEGMYHNLNTLQSRSGNQLPFSSINYGTCTLPEGRMVTKALLNGSIKGVGKLHKTAIFPCGIFQYMKGINDKPGTPNYDLYRLALESTARRLYPNYVNVDWSGNAGYDINNPDTYMSTMGCRTMNGADINANPGVNPQTKDGRGNICPVTIILPTLAMEAGNVEDFMELLDEKIHEAKDMLIERFEYICSQPASAAKFMYENGTMAGYVPEEGIRSALKHGTLTIGQIGIAETLQILLGCDHTEPEGMKLAKRIEQLYKDRCAEFKQQYKLNFGVYYTPAESLCYTAMKRFKEDFGEIPNVSDREYFTNSIHVPVWKEISPFDKIDIESELTGYSSAGCITYVELEGAVLKNIDALEQIVNYAMDKDIPYFALNVPADTCLECGWQGEIGNKCPECGSENIQRLRRVTGYLTGDYKTAFNKGKIAETEDRFKHSKKL